MSKAIPAIHGNDHLPGHPDPIPGLAPPWAALYDNYVYGQSLGTGAAEGEDVTLMWPQADMSDTAGDFFRLTPVANAEYGIDEWQLDILQSGVYAFSLQVEWDDANVGESQIRYYLRSRGATANFDFPGATGGAPFGRTISGDVLHRSEDFSDWESMDVLHWTVPVQIDVGVEWDFCVKAIAMNYFPLSPHIDEVFGYKRCWVTRIGPLDFAGASFNSGLH